MDFDLLKDLSKTVARDKSKHIEILGKKTHKKNKIDILYEGLVDDRFKTDKDTVRYFYKSHNVKYPAYIRLKNKLSYVLLNTVLFVDVNQPSFNERSSAYFTAYKEFAAACVLMLRLSCRSSIYFLELILEKTIKYEFVELSADISRIIRREYARSACDYNKSRYYAEINRKYEEKRHHEMIAMDYYENLIDYYLIKRSPNLEIYKCASSYFEELYPLLEKVDTSAFYFYTYNMCIIKFFSSNDILNALEYSNLLLKILEKRPNTNRSMLSHVIMQRIACNIQLRHNDQIAIKQDFTFCFSLIEKKSLNWFRLNELYFYYCIYRLKFNEALSVYAETIPSMNFLKLDGVYYDNWRLLGGYLHLISRLSKLDYDTVEETDGSFRYHRLFNEIEVLKKDKEGMNIPLILLPVLYELAQEPSKRTKEIHVDALEKYRQRWLVNDMNKRSNCFFKMVIALAKDETLSATSQRKINKELEILKSETPEIARQNFAIEIIPYETLWELLMAKAYPKQASNSANSVDTSILPKSKSNSIRASR